MLQKKHISYRYEEIVLDIKRKSLDQKEKSRSEGESSDLEEKRFRSFIQQTSQANRQHIFIYITHNLYKIPHIYV